MIRINPLPIHTHTCSHTHAPIYLHRNTPRLTHLQGPTLTHTHTCTQTRSHAFKNTQAPTPTHLNTQTLIHTRTHSHPHTHTHTRILSHMPALKHTNLLILLKAPLCKETWSWWRVEVLPLAAEVNSCTVLMYVLPVAMLNMK
jgi:hypothetical protein